MAGIYEFVVGLKDNFSTGFTSLNQGLGSSINQAGGFTFAMNNVNTALGSFGTQFNAVITPGIEFEKNMKEVQAIIGVAGAKLNELGANACKLAEDFGGTASTGLESYKIILRTYTETLLGFFSAYGKVENGKKTIYLAKLSENAVLRVLKAPF